MKYKIGDYVIFATLIFKVVHINKWFKRYNIKVVCMDTQWLKAFYYFYPDIIKVKEKELKGLISFD